MPRGREVFARASLVCQFWAPIASLCKFVNSKLHLRDAGRGLSFRVSCVDASVLSLRVETLECRSIAPCDLGCELQDGMTKPPNPKPCRLGGSLYTMSDVIKSWCKVTQLVALAAIASVAGTRAGLPSQGCSRCTAEILSCQQGKRAACGRSSI